MRKIGINLAAKEGLSTEEYAAKIASLGFESVFTGVPAPDVAENIGNILAKNGLAWETMHAPYRRINDIWHDTADGVAMYRSLTDSVDRCRAMGVPILVVHLSSGRTPPSLTDIGRARFCSLVEYAVGHGVKIAFENQRMLANLAWTFEEFASVPEVGFCYDCGHEFCFTPGREYMPLFGKRLICTHIHDNNCEFNRDMHLIPFDGKADFDRVARQIRESGFEGTLMLELIAKNSTLYDATDIETYLARAAAAAKRLRAMVDGE